MLSAGIVFRIGLQTRPLCILMGLRSFWARLWRGFTQFENDNVYLQGRIGHLTSRDPPLSRFLIVACPSWICKRWPCQNLRILPYPSRSGTVHGSMQRFLTANLGHWLRKHQPSAVQSLDPPRFGEEAQQSAPLGTSEIFSGFSPLHGEYQDRHDRRILLAPHGHRLASQGIP